MIELIGSKIAVESFGGICRDLEALMSERLGFSALTKPPRNNCQNLHQPVSFVLLWEIRLSLCCVFG